MFFFPAICTNRYRLLIPFPGKFPWSQLDKIIFLNLFPTDLHGPVNKNYYIVSLRQDGKACRQVMRTGNILITEVHCDFYKTAYALGKNHMQEMKEKREYPFGNLQSENFGLPPSTNVHFLP